MNRTTLLLAAAMIVTAACGNDPAPDPLTTAPTVTSTGPAKSAVHVARNAVVTAKFSETMAIATISGTTFTLKAGLSTVPAVVTYEGTTATLTPTAILAANTVYTASVTTGVRDLQGDSLHAVKSWTFTTVATPVNGPAVVTLGTAANYVILAKSAITTTGTTAITGNLGLSPAAASFITGFALSAPPTTYSTSALVTGNVYAANYATPTPSNLTTAVLDMQNAFTTANGRTLPDFINLGAGNLQGLTLVPGLYKWGTGVSIPSAVTLSGGANDIWIFQIAQGLTVGNGAIVTLTGGATANHVFWVVAGSTTLGTTSQMKGIILCKTNIAFNTGSSLLGRALAQTAVTLNATTVTHP